MATSLRLYQSSILFSLFLLIIPSVAWSGKLVSLNTRPGVEQKFELIKSKNPIASIILFPGGRGTIKLSSGFGFATVNKQKGNFLVRTKKQFAKQEFTVALIDAPSDKQSDEGMYYGFRTSDKHTNDINAIVGYLKQQADVPVWLVGTSRGTESAAQGAITLSNKIRGVVLTSSISEENEKGSDLPSMELSSIKVPVLIVAHNKDSCWVTPPPGAEEIKKGLINSSKVEVKYFSGGYEESRPCRGRSHHGFLGIEKKVVKYIAGFIKEYSK